MLGDNAGDKLVIAADETKPYGYIKTKTQPSRRKLSGKPRAISLKCAKPCNRFLCYAVTTLFSKHGLLRVFNIFQTQNGTQRKPYSIIDDIRANSTVA